MGPSSWRQLALAAAFARAAILYWLAVFPLVRHEVAHWRRRADAIPDSELRRLALETLRNEEGNLEGAAAFAAFVPRAMRTNVIRAAVAFQAVYDYVDSLVEQPANHPLANGHMLHQALDVATTPGLPHLHYYAHHPQHDDGGYLASLVDTCRTSLDALPSYPTVHASARRAVARMVKYQTLIHGAEAPCGTVSLREWAQRETPPGLDLCWWETAAAAASSLLVFALIAAASRPDLAATDVDSLEATYFPWIGALHVLLDSLVDQPDDLRADHASLVAHYETDAATAHRMSTIAHRAGVEIERLHDPTPHRLLLTAMSCFYLASAPTRAPGAALASSGITATLGALCAPMLVVLRMRQAVSTLRERGRTPANRRVYSASSDL